ncbi:MAG: hydroxyacid dehydrogenase [Clostridia bacterium]|nr:hydroxyacid dehydrogenase [Clostridia bacterium]
MKICFLDAGTLGDDLSLDSFLHFGEVATYSATDPSLIEERASGSDVLVVNKAKLNRLTLGEHPTAKLICLAATGYDNVDLDYCREKGIGVCNVVGYSTNAVTQVTVSMALSLLTHLSEYDSYVKDGSYTESGVANRLSPVYHEIYGKTWGIVGFGNIGRAVARVAEALGCKVLVYKRTPVTDYPCVSFEEICRASDILSLHVPLNDETNNLLDREHIAMLKPSAIVVNVARGAVADEAALADALKEGRIGGLGVDVYSKEPFSKEHPYTAILGCKNLCLTPHMAWGGYETRVRLLDEIMENIHSFYSGGRRSRVD